MAFRIPIAQTVVARSATEGDGLAEELGLPVAMKIDSPPSPQGRAGRRARINLRGLAAVRSAYQEILESEEKRPDAISSTALRSTTMVISPTTRVDGRRLPRPVFGQ